MNEQVKETRAGRQDRAIRNDERILQAAREVFVADPGAPIAAVAHRAGVGISALYRRYASKEQLLQRLNLDGLRQYIAAAEAALAHDGDPGEAFERFMHAVVDADTHSLTQRLAGTFEPTEELNHQAARSHELVVRLFDRVQTAGAVRSDLVVDDLSFIFEQLAAVRLGDPERTAALRRRYLAIQLDGLRARPGTDLPGPPPGWGEIAARWET
jgi:AcrR family transcriptional regulator